MAESTAGESTAEYIHDGSAGEQAAAQPEDVITQQQQQQQQHAEEFKVSTSHDQILIVDNDIVESPGARSLCGAITLPDAVLPDVVPDGYNSVGAACGLRISDLREKGKGLKSKFEEKGELIKERGEGLINKLTRQSSNSGLSSKLSSSASLYDPSLYLCGGDSMDCIGSDVDLIMKAREEQQPIPASIIGDPSRTVCVVTTAALPWRTGTAVNPLLRALYLVRYQNERRKELELQLKAEQSADQTKETTKDRGSVVLVIPWLESHEDRLKLYGPKNTFSNGPTGIIEQEEWIRNYSSERCGMPTEASQLKLIFYPAFYLAGFGSIFPKVDLCNFIPRELVDVAILEEPEHLNWFRMPNMTPTTSSIEENNNADSNSTEQNKEGSNTKESSVVGESGVYGQKVEVTIDESSSHDNIADMKPTISMDVEDSADGESSNVVAAVSNKGLEHGSDIDNKQQAEPNKGDSKTDDTKNDDNNKLQKKYIDKTKLGWTHRFRFVVGIVHTNYEAYARQYGIGASLIAAPAIGAVSALTIRAHCHQVIKLSDTLPSFAPGKEVTCNVHGVRREFLEGVDLTVLSSASSPSEVEEGNAKRDGRDNESGTAGEPDAPSPVYFIGKLVWAKGFDLMLELQDIFRKRNKGNYFHIDIYGGGPDEKAIARAFHGRNHLLPTKRPKAVAKEATPSPDSSSHPVDSRDLSAAAVFTNPQSIKDQSSQVLEQMKQEQLVTDGSGDDVVSRYLSLGFEVCQINGSATYVKESRRNLLADASSPEEGKGDKNPNNPLDILGDLSGKSFDTGVKTSQAVYNIADSSIKNILNMSFSQLKHPLKARQLRKEKNKEKEAGDESNSRDTAEEDKPKFVFDPPVSRYEWRRHPIPAKFPGVIDHAQLKNVPHKIFLNPSTSEVLCTTTAEALAMNKFVILPKHPSNEFFLQFTNCLAYETLEECAEKMAWALERAPTPLSEEERRKFTWEAATERLLDSSVVTVKQAKERAENGMDKTDARIAYWLSESGEKSNMIRNLFHKNGGGGSGNHSPVV